MSTDLEQLLRDAAPAPRGEWDLEALYRRGMRRRKVRSALRAGGAVASIAAIVAIGLTALPRSVSELPPIAGTPDGSAPAAQDSWLVARDGDTVDAEDLASIEPHSREPLIDGQWAQAILDAVIWGDTAADLADPVVAPDGSSVFVGLRGAALVNHQLQRAIADDLSQVDAAWWDAGRWVVVGFNDESDAMVQIVDTSGELVLERVLPELPNGEAIGHVAVEELPGDSPTILVQGVEAQGEGDRGWELPSRELENGVATSWGPRGAARESVPGEMMEWDGIGYHRLSLPGGGEVEVDVGQSSGAYELHLVVLGEREPYTDRATTSDPAAGEEAERILAVVAGDEVALTRLPAGRGSVVADQDGALWSVSVTDEDFTVTPVVRPDGLAW